MKTTLLAIAVFPLLLVAAGCASFDGAGLKPGQATSASGYRAIGATSCSSSCEGSGATTAAGESKDWPES